MGIGIENLIENAFEMVGRAYPNLTYSANIYVYDTKMGIKSIAA